MILLKKATVAPYSVSFFVEDALNPGVGKTGLSPIMKIRKPAGAWITGNVGSGACAEIGLGKYEYTPDGTDTSAQGFLEFQGTDPAGNICWPIIERYFVDANYGQDDFSARIAALSIMGIWTRDIWRRWGLDKDNPLTTDKAAKTIISGDVTQDVDESDPTKTVVTRQ